MRGGARKVESPPADGGAAFHVSGADGGRRTCPPPLGVIPHNLCSLAACLASLGARLLPFLRHLASGQVEAAAAAVDSPASTTSASYLVLFPAVGAEERTGSRTAIITSATGSVT